MPILSRFKARIRPLAVLALGIGLLVAGAPLSSFALAVYRSGALPNAQVTIPYEVPIGPSDSGPGPYSWRWEPQSGSSLPLGLSINFSTSEPLNYISGMPTSAGSYDFRVIMTDSLGVAHASAFGMAVRAPALGITPDAMPNGTVGTPYRKEARLVDGSGAGVGGYIRWGVTNGILPPGLDFVSSAIVGTPTVAGTYPFRLYLVYAEGTASYGYRDYSITINPASVSVPLGISAAAVPAGTVGTSFSHQFVATGGTAPYRWRVLDTLSLPPGITVDTAGRLSGTPSAAGTYRFTVKVEDVLGASFGQDFIMSVAAASSPVSPLAVSVGLPFLPGTVGTSYSPQILRATGGNGAYSWSISSGALPPGLSVAADGIVSGTPSAAGTYLFTARVQDTDGRAATAPYSIVVNPAAVIVPPIIGGTDPLLAARLENLRRIGISINALVKLPDDGNRFTQQDSAVYYIGGDGRRHAFPNDKIYFTWYSNFSGVRVIGPSDLASLPLGVNVVYKPGVRMVKFQTDPKVYLVTGARTLRLVPTEAIAVALYGSAWNRQIDDLSDAFYGDYRFGTDLVSSSEVSPAGLRASATYPGDVLPL